MQQPTRFKLKDFVHLIVAIKPRYWQLIVGLLLGLVATASQLLVPQFAKNLINGLSHHVNTGLIVAVIALFIGSAVISSFSGAILGFFGEDVVAKLREFLWQKLLRLPVHYFDNTKSGEITSRLVNDSTQVKNLLANSVPSMATSLLQLVGALILMLLMDWHMTLIMFIAVPLVMVVMMPVIRRSRQVGHARQDALADFNGEAGEVLSEVRLMKSSNAEDFEQKTGHYSIQKLYQIGLKEAVYDSVAGPLMTMVMMGLVVGMLAYGANRVAQGTMSMGMMFSFLMYLVQMIGPFGTAGRFFSDLAKTSGSTARINELLQEPEEDQISGVPAQADGQVLTMNQVDFGYLPDQPILKQVSFTAKPNTVVAFAGPSGGGKSTIFSLLERFYQPTAGTIRLGDTDVAALNLTSWREKIGLVGQDAAMLAGTIRYNLTYGLAGTYSDDQLWHVLQLAYAADFVKGLSEGLDTQVGERGVKLSGGQRQRLAIARAFLRDPQILLLDEATANLDAESEMMVQQALAELMKDRTTLIIAHRLSTIVDADEIYFIEKGQVSGHGTHKELVASHPLYREYVQSQLAS